MAGCTKALLVTANIASCFEQPDAMLLPWIEEFCKAVKEYQPQFVALHCQEVGGKHYEKSMHYVSDFVRSLLNHEVMVPFDKARIFVDEEYELADKFTALGNLYFVHQDVDDVQIWNFKDKMLIECEGKEVYAGNIEEIMTKEKAKFPQNFFPECKWSRKGFMRTRWCLNGTKFDMVNIHLFHDASNFIAMQQYPSPYTLNRRRALEHTLDRFHNDLYENVPFFIFGDFNFRLDTYSAVQKLTVGCFEEDTNIESTERIKEFTNCDGKVMLSVSKKSFQHENHDMIFLKDNGTWLQDFDKELLYFKGRLCEFPISFPPTYPFEEGPGDTSGNYYMKTRCPSWCDRILLSSSAKELIEKPVGLFIDVKNDEATVECCLPDAPCENFMHEPNALCFLHYDWCCCQPPLLLSTSQATPSLLSNNQFLPPSKSYGVSVASGVELSGVCIKSELSDSDMIDNFNENNFKNTHLNKLERTKLMLDKESNSFKRVYSVPLTENVLKDDDFHRVQTHTTSFACHASEIDNISRSQSVNLKYRLRADSSRLLSHHSSSTEEWFEEVFEPDVAELTKIRKGNNGAAEPSVDCIDSVSNVGTVLTEVSSIGTDEFYISEKTVQPSLDNLLLNDSCDHLSTAYLQPSIGSSVSGIPCGGKCTPSQISNDLETVSHPSTCRIEDNLGATTDTSHSSTRGSKLKNCCSIS